MNVLTNDVFKSEQSKTRTALHEIRDALMGGESGVIYGFHIDSSESDPSAAVTYLADAVGMTPAHMDFTNGKFLWGSWRDAFFHPRPCMLKSDGTVDYYLDPNDYSKKYDGSVSDVADDTYDGNAMMEWGQGGKKIWYKIVPDTGDNTSASVYIADYQVDEDFRAWSFVNNQGVLVDHFYTPIYSGSLDGNGKLRSISHKQYETLCQNKIFAEEAAAAKLNNPIGKDLWSVEVLADVTIINLLLILISKTRDTQNAFGAGCCGQSAGASGLLASGMLDNHGQFFGYNDNNHAVKVFGMENWWGNQFRRFLGLAAIGRSTLYKMTHGRQDGSACDDYATSIDNSDYLGYLAGSEIPSTGFLKQVQFNENCFIPCNTGGSSDTYWSDYFYSPQNLTTIRCTVRGGSIRSTEGQNGAFYMSLYNSPSTTQWYIGAALSCKPFAQ